MWRGWERDREPAVVSYFQSGDALLCPVLCQFRQDSPWVAKAQSRGGDLDCKQMQAGRWEAVTVLRNDSSRDSPDEDPDWV